MIRKSPLMEYYSKYLREHHQMCTRFEYHGNQSSSSWDRRYGVLVPALWQTVRFFWRSIWTQSYQQNNLFSRHKVESESESTIISCYNTWSKRWGQVVWVTHTVQYIPGNRKYPGRHGLTLTDTRDGLHHEDTKKLAKRPARPQTVSSVP